MSRRKIHINDDVWQYTIGGSHIVIWSPSMKRYLFQKRELKGCYYSGDDNWWRGHDGYRLHPVTIKNHIKDVILKGSHVG